MNRNLQILCILISLASNLYCQEKDTNNVMTSPDQLVSEIDTELITYIEIMPEFPGGIKALMKYLSTSISIQNDSIIEGTVYIQFWVDTTGNAVDAVIVRGLNEYQNYESLRIVEAMPKWKPAETNGQLIKVLFTIPVVFKKH